MLSLCIGLPSHCSVQIKGKEIGSCQYLLLFYTYHCQSSRCPSSCRANSHSCKAWEILKTPSPIQCMHLVWTQAEAILLAKISVHRIWWPEYTQNLNERRKFTFTLHLFLYAKHTLQKHMGRFVMFHFHGIFSAVFGRSWCCFASMAMSELFLTVSCSSFRSIIML